MNSKLNKYISVAYQLYDVTDGQPELIEQTSPERPFDFISGFGITLEDFEKAIVDLNTGDTFDFTLQPEQAYGEYVDARVIDLDKQIFVVNGKFDSNNIYVDAFVPLQNEDGNRFMGHVLAISDDKVKMDLNHPLAGKTLNFKGHVVESREATNDEIQHFVNKMSGECGGCGGNCEHCGNEGEKHKDGGCGHHCHHHE